LGSVHRRNHVRFKKISLLRVGGRRSDRLAHLVLRVCSWVMKYSRVQQQPKFGFFHIKRPNLHIVELAAPRTFFGFLEECQWVWSKCWSFVFLISRLVFQHKLILHQLQDCSNDIAIPRSVGDHISPTIAPPIDCGAALP
jgi:hypothetical protein